MSDSEGPSRGSAPPSAASAPKMHAGPPPPGTPAAEVEAYYANLARSGMGPPPMKHARALTIASWAIGSFTIGYMVLFADFGKKEHVFSPLRRQFHTLTSGWTTLSETERQMLGIKDGSAPAAVGSKTEGAVQPQT